MHRKFELTTTPTAITAEALSDFADDYEIESLEDLENFRAFIHLLFMEPNIPLAVVN